MDKYETKLRLEEIDRLRKQKKFKKAARLADTIEWNRIRNVETLRNAADIYKECQEYKKSKELLEFAYERSPYSKSVLFALCEISLLCNDDQEATDYYREYCNVVPEGDSGIYILRFKMTRKFGGGLAEQIGILEELKERDRQEVWLYVLAVLYEQAGQIEKCVEQCDELSLWFGEGSYVYKALELKMKYANLTPEQQSIYSRKEIERARREAIREEERAKKEARATGRMPGKERRKTGKLPAAGDVDEEVRRRRRDEERTSREEEKEEDYHVKTINLNKYNTMDLQKALAEDLQKYVNDEPSVINRVDLNEAAQNSESAEIPAAYAEEQLSATEQLAPTQVIPDTQSVDSEEVFFEDSTEDLSYAVEVPKAPAEENKRLQEFKEQYSREMKGKVLPEGFGRLSEEGTTSQEALSFTGGIVEEKVLGDGTVELIKHFEEDAEPEVVKVSKDRRTGQTGPMSTGVIRRRPVPEEKRETRPIRLKSDDPDYVDMLPPTEERQVSGQLNIQDILAGWELQKKQMEEARKENFRKKTLENTGNMFADFDKEANSGLLATLENPALINSVTEQSTPDDFLKGVSVEDVKNGKKPTYLRKSDMAALEEGLKAGAVIEPEEEKSEGIDFAELGDTTVKAEPLKLGKMQPAEEAKEELKETAEVKDVVDASGEIAKDDNAALEAAAAVEEAKAEETKAEETVIENEAAEDIPAEDAGVAEEVKEAAPEKEKSLYFGSVTEQISGNIWDEVDNVVPTPVAETTGAVEDDETATRMISRESVEESLSEEYAETEEPAEELTEEPAEEYVEEPAEEEYAQEPVEESAEEEYAEEPVEEIPAQEELPAETAAQEESTEEAEDSITEEEEESEGEGDDQQNLIKELKKYFDIYMYSKKMKAQIMDAAENASLAAYCGNLIVTSDSPESAEQFARAFSKYLRNSDPNFTGKPARISAQAVNEKDVNEIFEKATNSCVVISRAGRLTNNSVNKILSCLNQEARGVEVILYDSKNEIRKLLERGPVLERFFNCRVDIVALSTEMLAEYGRKFALDQGYSIDDMAMLAFSERISELQVGTHEVTINEVKEIVDDATEHVNKSGPEKLFRTMNGTRYDENHRVILREKDFWYRGNREDKERDEDEPGKKDKKNKK